VFVGASDSAIYANGDTNPVDDGKLAEMDGVGGLIDNCRFWRCSNAISIKRQFNDMTIRNCRSVECTNGIHAANTAGQPTGHGKKIVIDNFKAKRTAGRPIQLIGSTMVSLRDVEIEDFGGQLAPLSNPGSVRQGGDEIAAVDLQSCLDWRIDNLLVRQTGSYEELVPVTGSSPAGPVAALKVGTSQIELSPGVPAYSYGSTGGIGLRMKAYGVYQLISEDGAGTGANAFNMTVNNSGRAATTVPSTIAPGSLYQGRLLTQSVISTFWLHNASAVASIDVPSMTYTVYVRLSRP
jgi:hypothetical protein